MTEIDEPRIIPTEDFPFQIFLKQIADQIKDEELNTLKFFLSGEGGMSRSTHEKIKNVFDLYKYLKQLRLLSPNNLVTLQAMIWHLGRKDLYQQFVDFCKTNPGTLHFYVPSETPVNGYRHVNFHLRGTDACMRDKIQELRNKIAVLLCCPIEYIIPDGVEPTDSVYVTFMIPEWCIDVLMKIQPEDKARLNSFGVDRFKVGDDYVDCKDFQEGDERPDMDKDTIVSKIIQENNKLATDLEHFQVSYYDSERALKEMKSQYDDAMKEVKLARSEVEELKENAANLTEYLLDFKYTIEKNEDEIYSLKHHLLPSSTDNDSCRDDILYSRYESQLSQENLHDLEQKSCLIQANLIELFGTNKACEITAEIMSRVQLNRQDSIELERYIHTLVGSHVFEEVYKEVEDLRRIADAITVQQTLAASIHSDL